MPANHAHITFGSWYKVAGDTPIIRCGFYMVYSGVVEVNFTHMHQGYFTLTDDYTIIPVSGKEATEKDMSEWITWNRQELTS